MLMAVLTANKILKCSQKVQAKCNAAINQSFREQHRTILSFTGTPHWGGFPASCFAGACHRGGFPASNSSATPPPYRFLAASCPSFLHSEAFVAPVFFFKNFRGLSDLQCLVRKGPRAAQDLPADCRTPDVLGRQTANSTHCFINPHKIKHCCTIPYVSCKLLINCNRECLLLSAIRQWQI